MNMNSQGDHRNYDITIIGGGITGCGVAYHLAKTGLSVAVLERGNINQEASGRNAGGLYYQLQNQAAQLNQQQKQKLAQTIPLVKASRDAWQRLDAALDDDIGLVETGGLMVAETDAEVAQLYTKYALEQEWGIDTNIISGNALKAIAPNLSDQIQAATFCRWEGQANPRKATIALAKAAIEFGVDFYLGSEVIDIEIHPTEYTIVTSQKSKYHSPLVLNACGAWAGKLLELLGLPNPVQAIPLQMAVTEKTELSIPLFFQFIGQKLSLKQAKSGNILIGGGWHAQILENPEKMQVMPLYENLACNLALAVKVIPKLNKVNLLRTWTGLVAWTEDGLPILGEFPSHPGFYTVCGGSGFSLAPLFAELISSQILQKPSFLDVSFLNPQRFLSICQKNN